MTPFGIWDLSKEGHTSPRVQLALKQRDSRDHAAFGWKCVGREGNKVESYTGEARRARDQAHFLKEMTTDVGESLEYLCSWAGGTQEAYLARRVGHGHISTQGRSLQNHPNPKPK